MTTAGKSYEAWKESLIQADADGDGDWGEDWSGGSWPTSVNRPGAVEFGGLSTILLLGAGLMFAGAVLLLFNVRHFASGRRTTGMVVGHKDYFNGRSSSVRAPVVRYSAPGGTYDVEGSLSVPRRFYPLDKEVSVLYLRSDPGNAVIADFIQMFMIPMAVGGVGLICFTGTAGLMFWNVRSELRSNPPTETRQSLAVVERPAADNEGAAKEGAKASTNDEADSDSDLVDAGCDEAEAAEGRDDCHAVARR